jgi:hypothetical protein
VNHLVHEGSAVHLRGHLSATVSELFYAEHPIIVNIKPNKGKIVYSQNMTFLKHNVLVENFHFLKQVSSNSRNKPPNCTELHHVQSGEAYGSRHFSIRVEYSIDLLVRYLRAPFVGVDHFLSQTLSPGAL